MMNQTDYDVIFKKNSYQLTSYFGSGIKLFINVILLRKVILLHIIQLFTI